MSCLVFSLLFPSTHLIIFRFFRVISERDYIKLVKLKMKNELTFQLTFEKVRYLHFFGLGAALVAELDQRDHHGQTQTPDQDVEDSCYVTERQSAGLLLVHTHRGKERGQPPRGTR